MVNELAEVVELKPVSVSQTGAASDVHVGNVSTTVSFFNHLYLINSMRNFVENYTVYGE